METKRTDKKLLASGLQKMAISLLLMFVGPSLFYVATGNKEKPLYIPLLILSFILCAGAIYFAFRGLQTIMKSLFNKGTSSN